MNFFSCRSFRFLSAQFLWCYATKYEIEVKQIDYVCLQYQIKRKMWFSIAGIDFEERSTEQMIYKFPIQYNGEVKQIEMNFYWSNEENLVFSEFRSIDDDVCFTNKQTSQSGLTEKTKPTKNIVFIRSYSNSDYFFYFEISLILFRHCLSLVVLKLVDTIFDCCSMVKVRYFRYQWAKVDRERANSLDRWFDFLIVESSIESLSRELRTTSIVVEDEQLSFWVLFVHKSIRYR